MEKVAQDSFQVATQEKLLDHFCLKSRHHVDIGTSERILNDMAESKVRIPAIFKIEPQQQPELEYIDYEVLPEMESLINETVKALK